jgi:signal transduction histidine kinase
MGPLLFGLFCSFLLVVSLYSFLRWRDLKVNWDSIIEGYEQKQNELDDRQTILDEKIKKLEKYKDIPDIIEKSRKIKEEVESRIEQANQKAEQIINLARIEARKVHLQEIEDAESYLNDIKANLEKTVGDAKNQSDILKQEAKDEAKRIVEVAKQKATLLVEETILPHV